jgi:cell division septum initiation protein DivIVA
METTEVDALIKQLATGFEVLQTEYQKLSMQYQGLERKLATAREQVSDMFVPLCM